MKISRRDAQALLGVLGVLIFALSYQFGFVKLKEKTELIVGENQQLESQLKELEMLNSQREKFAEETETMNREVTQFKSVFPPDFKTEDGIMLTVDLENKTNLTVKSLEIGSAVAVFELGKGLVGQQGEPAEVTEQNPEENVEETESSSVPIVMYNVPYTLNYEVTNHQLKESLKFINDYKDRKVIQSLNASYNSDTGKLSGSINVNAYVLSGTEVEYLPPYVPYVDQGTDDVFGTVESVEQKNE